MILTKFLIFLLFFFLIESKYEIILDRTEVMGDEACLKFHTYRIKKLNRSFAVSDGIMELKCPLSNSEILSFEAYNLAGGQYKKIFGRTLGEFCEILYEKHWEKDVRKLLSHTNISVAYGTCPIPPQFIKFDNFAPDGVGDYLPLYLPGNERWKMDVWVHKKDGKFVGGTTVYYILRDNQKLFDSTFG